MKLCLFALDGEKFLKRRPANAFLIWGKPSDA
jgi:hypothetical protein